VDATDLSAAMHKKHTLTKLGRDAARVTGTLSGDHRNENHFKSMLSNFDGLQQIADDGNLRIFQRIYRGLYNATPDGDKRSTSPRVNHMATATRVDHIAMFQNLVMALSNAKTQPWPGHPGMTQLDQIVGAVMGFTLLIQQKDIPLLRAAIASLVAKAKKGDVSPVELMLNKFLTIQQNPQGYQELKDALFHFVPSLNRLQIEPTGLIAAIPALTTQPLAWNDLMDKFLRDASTPKGNILTVGANIRDLNDARVNSLRDLAILILGENPTTHETYLPAAASLFSDGYAVRPADYSKVWQALNVFGNDPRVTNLHPAKLVDRILSRFEGKHGLGDSAAYLLMDETSRTRFIRVGHTLAKNGEVADLSRVLIGLINSGGVDSALHFVFDNLSPASLQLGRAGKTAPHPRVPRRRKVLEKPQ